MNRDHPTWLKTLARVSVLLCAAVVGAALGAGCPATPPDDDNEDPEPKNDAGPDCTDAFYPDADGDGHGAEDAEPTIACEAPADTAASADDCDDADAANFPGNAEVCDASDNNCDGAADEGLALTTYFADVDADDFGDPDVTAESCGAAPVGFIADDTDCDDADADAFPGNPEVCDAVDNDCNGDTDEGVTLVFFADTDGDASGDVDSTVEACVAPTGYVATSDDCDDGDPERAPGLPEVCDTKDNNCDSAVDEGVVPTWFPDPDGDGFAIGDADGVLACDAPPGTTTSTGDCDEFRADVNPGAVEAVCDFVDTDCSGSINERIVPDNFATLQAAITATPNNGHICLRPGTYVGTNTVTDKVLRIEGSGSSGEGITVLDGADAGSVLRLENAGASRVAHLRLQNGRFQAGGGMLIQGGAAQIEDVVISNNECTQFCTGVGLAVSFASVSLTDVTVSDNVIASTTQNVNGGALGLRGVTGTLTRVRLLNNSVAISNNSMLGLALFQEDSNLTIRDLVMRGNQFTGTANGNTGNIWQVVRGSADVETVDASNNTVLGPNTSVLRAEQEGTLAITNGLFSFNQGNEGRGLIFQDITATLSHLTIAANFFGNTTPGPVLTVAGNTPTTITNSIVALNVAGIAFTSTGTRSLTYSAWNSNGTGFSGIADPSGTDGNISAAPGFVNGPGGNFQLSVDGAAVDAGDPATFDLDGSRADMGAYGGLAPVAPPPG